MSHSSKTRLLMRYRQLVEVSHHLASTLDMDALLKYIRDAAVDLVRAEEALLLVYDQNCHRLYLETAAHGDSSPSPQKLFVPEESTAAWVALNRLPQIINDVQQDQRHFTSTNEQVDLITRSMIAVPLVAKQKLIGVLEVLNKQRGQFDDEDQEILLALAAQAAAAIQTSQLFHQSDLISEYVHELRTPMSSIFTASYLLQRPELAPDQRFRLAQTIHHETQRLNELSSNFLDLANLESGRAGLRLTRFTPVPLFEECLQVSRVKAAEKGIEILLDAPIDLPELEADQDKIKQLVLNLLNNAVKYNCPKGKVWVRVWADPGSLIFSVKDTGVGIPADQLPELFTQFFRARNVERTVTGTGLSLSICRKIIELHNGGIQVESQIDQGATFTIQLPLQYKILPPPTV